MADVKRLTVLVEAEKARRIREEGDKGYWRDRAANALNLRVASGGSGGGYRRPRVEPW